VCDQPDRIDLSEQLDGLPLSPSLSLGLVKAYLGMYVYLFSVTRTGLCISKLGSSSPEKTSTAKSGRIEQTI
jgi:hypothetical protein